MSITITLLYRVRVKWMQMHSKFTTIRVYLFVIFLINILVTGGSVISIAVQLVKSR